MGGPVDSREVLQRFESHLDLVDRAARMLRARFSGTEVQFEELVSFGQEGLLDAARKFDASRGVAFAGYAHFRIRGAIMDGLRSHSRLPRRVYQRLKAAESAALYSEGAHEDRLGSEAKATAEQAHQQLAEHMAGMATAMAAGLVSQTVFGEGGETSAVSTAPDPEGALENQQLREAVRHAISDLPEKEATLIRRHYFEGERFDVGANELGLSKSWASRLNTRAIARLSRRLRGIQR